MTGFMKDKKQFHIRVGCILVFLFVSLPLFTSFLTEGRNLYVQLSRIVAIKEGRHFFGDTFFYLPALLYYLGCPLQLTWKLFLLAINGGTVWAAYKCFEKLFEDCYVGLLGTTLYSTAIYRTAMLYSETEVSELLLLLFVPMIIYGALHMLEEKRIPGRGVVCFVLGLSGLLRSQIIGFAVTVILLLLFLPVTLYERKKRENADTWGGWLVLKKLVWSGMFFVLINMSYLYTFALYYRTESARGQLLLGASNQEWGLQFAQLFMTFYQGGTGICFATQGLYEAAPIGLGILILVGILFFCYSVFIYGRELKREHIFYGVAVLGIGWGFTGLTLGNYPWHFLAFASLFFTILLGIDYLIIKRLWPSQSVYWGYAAALASVFFNAYLQASILNRRAGLQITENLLMEAGIITGELSVGAPGTIWYLLQVVSVVAVMALILLAAPIFRKTESREKA